MSRMKRPGLSIALCALVFIAGTSSVFARPKVMTNADVIDLTTGGVSEWNIIALVLANKSRFSVTPSDVAELRRAGVTEPVINAMTIQSSPLATGVETPTPTAKRTAKKKAARPASASSPAIPPSGPGADEERRAIEQFEAEQQANHAKFTDSREAGSPLAAQDELRMIQKFEAEQGAVTITPSESPAASDSLKEDEELRLIEEFESKKRARDPQDL